MSANAKITDPLAGGVLSQKLESREDSGHKLPTGSQRYFEQLLLDRYSCRAFRPDPVPRHIIDRILRTAQRTASWCNTQPWGVAVTSGEGTERLRKSLYSAATAHGTQKPDIPFPESYGIQSSVRRRESGSKLYEALGVDRADRHGRDMQVLENFRFFGAPHVAFIHQESTLGPYGSLDCGAYISNFLTSAAANNVDSVAQGALAAYPETLRQELGIGPDRLIVAGVSFGYADVDHPANQVRTSRAPLSEAVQWIDE